MHQLLEYAEQHELVVMAVETLRVAFMFVFFPLGFFAMVGRSIRASQVRKQKELGRMEAFLQEEGRFFYSKEKTDIWLKRALFTGLIGGFISFFLMIALIQVFGKPA